MVKGKPDLTPKLHVSFGGYSSKGIKEANQDAFTAHMPKDDEVVKFKGAAACIADGISGSKNAKAASQVACESFMLDYYTTPDYWTVKQSVSKVIESINAWLNQQDANNIDVKTPAAADAHIATFSAIVIKSHTAHIFHVGDSRIYHLKQGRLEQLTTDHSVMQGTLRPHLVRALGIESMIDIDYIAVPVTQGDRFLLSTDGFHDALSHQQLEALCNDAEPNLEKTTKRLIETALQNGSQDNASALMLAIDCLPEEQTEEVYQKMASLLIPPVLKVGDAIDHFSIVRILENGARSHIYLAKSQLDDKRYVLKMPAKNYQDDDVYLKGFALEQWVGTRMNHPTLMKIYPPPNQTQFLYHICEYIEGITLRQWMTDRPRVSVADARQMLKEMIKPVRYMHRNNLVHRDLKPENFIINNKGLLTLIDYGTVQVASIQEFTADKKELPVGDIGYIAPELLVYGRSTPRSDLFSLASIVYELLTKELPYTAILSNQDSPKQFDEWVYRPISTSASALQMPPLWVDRVLCKALAPNPKLRYSTLSEFEADLLSPSAEILEAVKSVPLIEKNPLFFWKMLVVLLVMAFFAQFAYFSVVH